MPGFFFSPTRYIFTDAHISGSYHCPRQCNIRCKACSSCFKNNKCSRKEWDLEAVAKYFALGRVRLYLVGAPSITVITDHKPLCSIFNGKKQRSTSTDHVKLRHQDIGFTGAYQKGKINPFDYLSRRGKPFVEISQEQQEEADEIKNIYYISSIQPLL